MAVIPGLKRLRQEDHSEFQLRLSYIVGSKLAWTNGKTLSQKNFFKKDRNFNILKLMFPIKPVDYTLLEGKDFVLNYLCSSQSLTHNIE